MKEITKVEIITGSSAKCTRSFNGLTEAMTYLELVLKSLFVDKVDCVDCFEIRGEDEGPLLAEIRINWPEHKVNDKLREACIIAVEEAEITDPRAFAQMACEMFKRLTGLTASDEGKEVK